jgi:hypothetical protein
MSLSRTVVNVVNDHKELVYAYTAVMFGTCIGLAACIGLNKILNKHVIATCNTNLNEIVRLKTAVGDSYGCVSKMVLHGPPAPLKP